MAGLIIKLNLSGTLFEVEKDKLIQSDMFKGILEDIEYDGSIINVYRSPHVFKHVLSYLIDNKYPYPLKYESELKYYVIPYKKLYNPVDDVSTQCRRIIEKNNSLTGQIEKMSTNMQGIDTKLKTMEFDNCKKSQQVSWGPRDARFQQGSCKYETQNPCCRG